MAVVLRCCTFFFVLQRSKGKEVDLTDCLIFRHPFHFFHFDIFFHWFPSYGLKVLPMSGNKLGTATCSFNLSLIQLLPFTATGASAPCFLLSWVERLHDGAADRTSNGRAGQGRGKAFANLPPRYRHTRHGTDERPYAPQDWLSFCLSVKHTIPLVTLITRYFVRCLVFSVIHQKGNLLFWLP